MDEFVGIVKLFAGNYAPEGWAFCHGQVLYIQQNPILHSIIGTTYGGDGYLTFALPDLRGRVPMGAGQGLAHSPVSPGQLGGGEYVAAADFGGMPSYRNLPPYLGLNYIICTHGLYPPVPKGS